jgi:hypothetical protein
MASMQYQILTVVLLLCGIGLQAQSRQKKSDEGVSLVTGQVLQYALYEESTEDNKSKRNTSPASSEYIQFYIREARPDLESNRCIAELKDKYHVRYVIITKQQQMPNRKFFWNNLRARWKLMFKNGPGWQKRMNRDIEDCRERLGGSIILD